MSFKERMAQTKKAIASTASKTAGKTKSAINNAHLKEKTRNAMEKTVEAKNVVVEKTKDMKQKASVRYHSFKDKDEETTSDDINMQTPTAVVPPTAVDGASNSELTRVFGVPIEIACERSNRYYPYLPDVVFKCFSYLYEKATAEEGIFRLSGSNTTIQQMKSSFNQGCDVDLNECYDPHAISGLLKLYLRELPDSIVPAQVCSGPDKLTDLKRKVEELPPTHRCILANLMRLLQQISRNEAVTKMTVNNLVIIFVPTLACSSDIAHALISHASDMFSCEQIISFSLLRVSDGSSEGGELESSLEISLDDTEIDSAYVE